MQKINEIRSIISRWLESRLEGENYQWLITKGDLLKDNPEDWELYTSFSAVPKYTGKKKISLSEDERKKADMIRNGWDPSAWSLDELGRTFLMLCYTEQGKDEFLDKIEKTFVTSDMNEAVALYKALPLYPFPEQFRLRAAEGVRSNITTVFNAVALDNPYPKENLDEGAWNQIVLKALFVGSPLYRIQGVDERANETLAKILVEYAHERWSAGRTVSPELWRPVGPFLYKGYENEIKRVLEHSEKIQKQAAVLALESSHYSGKGKLVAAYDAVIKDVEQQGITWDDIGKAFEASKNN
jgi:hypothetical protein